MILVQKERVILMMVFGFGLLIAGGDYIIPLVLFIPPYTFLKHRQFR